MNARITILCENTVGPLLGSGEHGFSAFLETDQGNFLLDTGSGRSIVENAIAFRKDLTSIRKIFLSHGHTDHTGGLPEVLKLRGEVEIHAHPGVFADRIALPEKDGGRTRYAGIPYRQTYLEILGGQFILNRDFVEVGQRMFLSGEVPKKTLFEKPDPRLQVNVDQTYILDPIADDQSLILDTPQGLVIVFGCAHSGMINIIHHAIEKTAKDRIHGLIGGTHLGFFASERLEASIEALKAFSVSFIGVSHCTGFRAAARLFQEFGERFRYGHVGAVFEV